MKSEKMSPEETEKFFLHLKVKAIEIAPDYSNIKNEEYPFTLLWAIVCAYEGTSAAVEDMHKLVAVLAEKYHIPKEEIEEIGHKILTGQL